MSSLTVVVNIHAGEGRIELVRSELERVTTATRADQGCTRCDLYQDAEDPCHFLSFEHWESRELWQAHTSTPHMRAYVEATSGDIAQFSIGEFVTVI